MANATKKDFDLHVALGGIASRNCHRGQRRRLTGSRISFRFVCSWLHGETCCSQLNIASQCHGASGMLRAVPAFLRDLLIRSFANRRPNAATPGAAGDGNSDREVYNVFSIAPRDDERRANAQSAVSHPHCGGRNNIGSTIGTSRGDPRDASNLCAAIPLTVARRSRQNSSATLARDQAKAWRA